jgi:hypothetical protein
LGLTLYAKFFWLLNGDDTPADAVGAEAGDDTPADAIGAEAGDGVPADAVGAGSSGGVPVDGVDVDVGAGGLATPSGRSFISNNNASSPINCWFFSFS